MDVSTDTTGVVSYYPDGSLKRVEKYHNNALVTGKCFSANGEEIPFYPMEQLPEFPGGQEALNAFLSRNTKYPEKARRRRVEGVVHIRFLVDTDGEIKNAEVIKSVDPLLDAEALRVIRAMPKWKPGQQDGDPVSVYFVCPLAFSLK